MLKQTVHRLDVTDGEVGSVFSRIFQPGDLIRSVRLWLIEVDEAETQDTYLHIGAGVTEPSTVATFTAQMHLATPSTGLKLDYNNFDETHYADILVPLNLRASRDENRVGVLIDGTNLGNPIAYAVIFDVEPSRIEEDTRPDNDFKSSDFAGLPADDVSVDDPTRSVEKDSFSKKDFRKSQGAPSY